MKRIVSKAQAFRDFLQQFTNGNQICRTSEEMPIMLFYLRKLEGAEVLLTYETNSFRQELHKWQPIATEPPPVLEKYLSTRKPRPTKLQKAMKAMGAESRLRAGGWCSGAWSPALGFGEDGVPGMLSSRTTSRVQIE